MSDSCDAVCRRCRREGEKLFLKGERCFTSKCAVERREGVPGVHAKGRQSHSDYKVRMREKQKLKRMYGLTEKGCRRVYEMASRVKGVTGSQMLVHFELRLDNVVYRLGFAGSRRQARQLVAHGHINVNGKRVSVPSYEVRINDVVEVRGKLKTNIHVAGALESASGRSVPDWLILEKSEARGTVKAVPTREQMPQNINEQLVVELYSK